MNNQERDNYNARAALFEEEPDLPELNGSWEKKNRNITAAAITGLIGIGALYFNVQSILTAGLIFIYERIYHITISGSIVERIKIFTTDFKVPVLVSTVFTEFVFMMLPTLWIVKKWHTTQIKKYLRIRLCSVKEAGLAVFITVSLLPSCSYLSELILRNFKIPEIFQTIESRLFTVDSFGQFILIVLAVAVTPAICEEIFFRGYVQRTLERTMGGKSVVIVGILFGLFHMEPLSLITLSVLGILFSFFYYRSKSIVPSSAAHFTNNLIALIFVNTQSRYLQIGITGSGVIFAVIIISSLILAAILFFIYLKTTSPHQR